MLLRLMRRLLAAALLALGVSALLFLVFESGLLGDPALVRLGKGASPRAVAAARLRLGIYSAVRDDAIRLDAAPGTRFLALEARGGEVLVIEAGGFVRAHIPVAGRSVRQLLADFPPAGLRASLQDDAVADWPARAVADALGLEKAVVYERPGELPVLVPVPAWKRFAAGLARLFVLDFGVSAASQQPIAPQLGARALRSLALTLPAFLLSTIIAVSLALLCAALRGGLDRLLLAVSVAAMSVSSLAYILFLQEWLAFDLGLFPIQGWEWPYFPFLMLPVLIWVIVSLGPDLRFYRTVMIEEAGRDFVRTARAKGLGGWTLLRRHVLPNALIPILTQFTVALPFLFLGSLLLERFFNIPGLGGWTVEAVMSHDQPVLQATTFLFALIYLASQWLADLGYTLVDPRVRRAR